MKNQHQRKVRKRISLLALFFMFWLGILAFRLIQLQVIDHTVYKTVVLEQNQNTEPIHPKRGTIYDRSGNILGRSVPRQSVFYTSFKGESHQPQIERIHQLKEILGLSENELQMVKKRIQRDDSFIWIRRKIDSEKSEKVKNLDLTGIYLEEENKRFYPYGKLAAHLIGRVNIDEVGASGIEYRYDSVLGGEKGKRLILRDAKRRKYQFETLKEPVPGKDLYLTIDETIQYIAEKELKKAILEFEAAGGIVIISQPSTGEILAMANYPTFDLNSPPLSIRNGAIHHTFDPGSTFKMITASAALESKKIDPSDVFDCSAGAISIAGKTIRDHKKFGQLSFPEVIIHSSNVGTIQVGQIVGDKSLFKTIQDFGFGQKTGIDLPAEEKGLFYPLSRWTDISVASLSIGYEISVTAIQMLQAINIIANKGVTTSPTVVRKSFTDIKDIEENPPENRRVLSEESAVKLAYILQRATEEGTGQSAQIKGYKVAGKTGTAQKFDPTIGGYSSSLHMASFVGYILDEKPVLSMIIVIDDPKEEYYGGQVAAPVFKEIATQILDYECLPVNEKSQDAMIIAEGDRKESR